MKTLVILNSIDEVIKFGIIEGDYSKFDNIFIGSYETDEKLQRECVDFLYYPNSGDTRFEFSEKSLLIENKQWDKVAVITIL